jgi:hypothetical protein
MNVDRTPNGKCQPKSEYLQKLEYCLCIMSVTRTDVVSSHEPKCYHKYLPYNLLLPQTKDEISCYFS